MFRHACFILTSAMMMLWSCLVFPAAGIINVYFNGTVLYTITAEDSTLILSRDENGMGSIFSLPFEEVRISPATIAKDNEHLIELSADGRGVILRNMDLSWQLQELADAVANFTNNSAHESPDFYTSNPVLLLCHPRTATSVFALLKQEPVATSLYSLGDMRAWRLFKPAINSSFSACPTYRFARMPVALARGETIEFEHFRFKAGLSGTEVKIEIFCSQAEATAVRQNAYIECVLINVPLPHNFLSNPGDEQYIWMKPTARLRKLQTQLANLMPEDVTRLCEQVYEQPLKAHQHAYQAAQNQWNKLPGSHEIFQSVPSKSDIWQMVPGRGSVSRLFRSSIGRLPVVRGYF